MADKNNIHKLDKASAEERILAAATEEFAAKGFFGARTQAIADAANINKAMLHYYFRTKEKLYNHVLMTAMAKFQAQAWAAWLTDAPIKERVNRVVDTYMDNYSKNPAFLKMILREAADGGERLRISYQKIDLGAGLDTEMTPMEKVERVSRELGIEVFELAHLMMSLFGMCLISFVSTPLMEGQLGMDFGDVDEFMDKRRLVIKSMASVWLDRHLKDAADR